MRPLSPFPFRGGLHVFESGSSIFRVSHALFEALSYLLERGASVGKGFLACGSLLGSLADVHFVRQGVKGEVSLRSEKKHFKVAREVRIHFRKSSNRAWATQGGAA